MPEFPFMIAKTIQTKGVCMLETIENVRNKQELASTSTTGTTGFFLRKVVPRALGELRRTSRVVARNSVVYSGTVESISSRSRRVSRCSAIGCAGAISTLEHALLDDVLGLGVRMKPWSRCPARCSMR